MPAFLSGPAFPSGLPPPGVLTDGLPPPPPPPLSKYEPKLEPKFEPNLSSKHSMEGSNPPPPSPPASSAA